MTSLGQEQVLKWGVSDVCSGMPLACMRMMRAQRTQTGTASVCFDGQMTQVWSVCLVDHGAEQSIRKVHQGIPLGLIYYGSKE